MATKRDKGRFTCKECEQAFGSSKDLEKHVKDAHFHLCPHCSSIFTSGSSFEKHFKDNHIQICSDCKDIFTTEVDLERHWKEKHVFVCTICKITFKKEETFKDHMKCKHEEKPKVNHSEKTKPPPPTIKNSPFICKLCTDEKVFQTPRALLDHTRNQHNKFLCIDCNIMFDSKHGYEEHAVGKHGKDVPAAKPRTQPRQEVPTGFKPIRCCKHSILKSCEDVLRHVRKAHRVYICPVCPSPFGEAKELVEHTYEDHTLKRSPCCERHTNQKSLENHMEGEHSSFRCTECQPAVYIDSPADFEAHIRSKHPSFVCFSCLRIFGTHSQLQKHIEVGDHSLHSCVKCLREFPGKDLLNRHMRYTHGIFVCDTCEMLFKTEELLKHHVDMNHVSSTIYCQKCGNVFKNRFFLTEHLKSGQCQQKKGGSTASQRKPMQKGGPPTSMQFSSASQVHERDSLKQRRSRGRSKSPGSRRGGGFSSANAGRARSNFF